MKPWVLKPNYGKGQHISRHTLQLVDQSQWTGPADQSEQTELFGKAGIKEAGTKKKNVSGRG